jgi:hypothetical protein
VTHTDGVTPPVLRRGFFARTSEYVVSGLRYWEPRRLIYNAVLVAVVAGHLLADWPGSLVKLSFDVFLGLFFLAVLANIAYCVAYLADLFLQFSGLEAAWQWGRPILLSVGIAFAATITHFFAKGILGG